jgi:hypothetical protein
MVPHLRRGTWMLMVRVTGELQISALAGLCGGMLGWFHHPQMLNRRLFVRILSVS